MTFLKCPDCGRGPIAHTLDTTCRNPAFFSEALSTDQQAELDALRKQQRVPYHIVPAEAVRAMQDAIRNYKERHR